MLNRFSNFPSASFRDCILYEVCGRKSAIKVTVTIWIWWGANEGVGVRRERADAISKKTDTKRYFIYKSIGKAIGCGHFVSTTSRYSRHVDSASVNTSNVNAMTISVSRVSLFVTIWTTAQWSLCTVKNNIQIAWKRIDANNWMYKLQFHKLSAGLKIVICTDDKYPFYNKPLKLFISIPIDNCNQLGQSPNHHQKTTDTTKN